MTLPVRSLCVLLLAGAAAALAGCGGEEPIRSYTVPREAEPKRTTYRILGAMFPADKPVWYIKFAGKQDELSTHEEAWEKFIGSVKHKSEKEVPDFELPSGWTKTGPRERSGIVTDEVIKIGGGSLEVTITGITDGPLSGLKANLVRWGNQQLDGDYDPATIESLATPLAAAGGKGLRVDLRGPRNPSGGPMMGKMK